jgi:CBS domain-containing protein
LVGADVLVGDVMSRAPAVVHASDTLTTARQLMLWSGVGALPILDAADRVVGMVTVHELLSLLSDDVAGVRRLSDFLPLCPTTIAASAKLDEASAMFVNEHRAAVPVVVEGELVGMITAADVLAARDRIRHSTGRLSGISAADLMHRHVVVTHEDEPLERAIWKMIDGAVRHAVVVDPAFRVVGILSDRDIRGAVGDPLKSIAANEATRHPTIVGTVMTRNPITVPQEAAAQDVAEIFLDERIGAVPVVRSDDTLVGIISYVDVIAHFLRPR